MSTFKGKKEKKFLIVKDMGKRKPKLKNKLSSIFSYFSSNQTRKNKTLKPSVLYSE